MKASLKILPDNTGNEGCPELIPIHPPIYLHCRSFRISPRHSSSLHLVILQIFQTMKPIYCLLLLLCPYASKTQQLRPGQTLPAIQLQMLNHPAKTISTTAFKGKLLLVDFWATWCSHCIKKFSVLDSMQRIYAKDFQVLLINSRSTGDTKEKLERFFDRYKAQDGTKTILPTAFNDTLFKKLLPHTNLPHYAWIDKQGKFIAATGPDEITPENILRALNGETAHLTGLFLMDSLDLSKPIFIKGNAGDGKEIISRSTFAGYIKGLRSVSRFKKDTSGLYTGFTIINTSLLHLITRAHAVFEPVNRIIISNAIAEKFVEKEGEDRFANYYSYERITPPVSMDELQQQVQRDIEYQFGIKAKWEPVPGNVYLVTVDTVLLKKYKTRGTVFTNTLTSSGKRQFINASLTDLILWLNTFLSRSVLQDQKIAFNLDLSIPPAVAANEKTLIEWLKAKGIFLEAAVKDTDRFIIYPSSN